MRRLVALAVGVVAAAAWSVLEGVPWPARLWAVCLLVVLPVLLIVQARAGPDPRELPRPAFYLTSLLTLWILAGLTAVSARMSGLHPAHIAVAPTAPAPLALWAVAATASGVALILITHVAGVRETPITRHLLPCTPHERNLFAALSITAGICEEFMFRGFLLALLIDALGATVPAVLLTSLAFGAMHAYQSRAGAARAGALGLILTAPVLATGSVLPAVIAHAGIDLIAGLLLGERLLD